MPKRYADDGKKVSDNNKKRRPQGAGRIQRPLTKSEFVESLMKASKRTAETQREPPRTFEPESETDEK